MTAGGMEKACLFCKLFFIVSWGALQPLTAWESQGVKIVVP